MIIINNELLYSLSIQAKENSVLLAKYNFQNPEISTLNKTLKVMEKGCVTSVEHHNAGTLTILLLKGRLKVNFYNADKGMSEEIFLDPKVGIYGIDISEERWYNIEVLDDNTVVFKIKTIESCAE